MPDGMWGRHDRPLGPSRRRPSASLAARARVRLQFRRLAGRHGPLPQGVQRTASATMPASIVALGRGHADVEHNILGFKFKGGEDDFDAVSVGGYWTRFGDSNWYLDGVLQGTWYDMDMTSNRRLLGLRDGETTASALPPRWKAAIRSTSATTGCSSRRRSWSTRPSTSTISTTAPPTSATPTPIPLPVGLA